MDFEKKILSTTISITQLSLLKSPPVGFILLLLLYLGFVLGLEYDKQDIPGEQNHERRGVRAGWLTITQLHS